MAFLQIILEDGAKYLVNRYFLQLYDEMFYKLMNDHPNDDVILIFTGESMASIESFINNINCKHLNCSNFTNKDTKYIDLTLNNKQNSSENIMTENSDVIRDNSIINGINEHSERTLDDFADVNDSADDNLKSTGENSYNININSNKSSDEIKLEESKDHSIQLHQCPFECSYSDKSQDKIYAHLMINHRVDIKTNHRIEITQFLRNLELKVSKKCVFLCQNPNFINKNSLRMHYVRNHAKNQSPETCSHCNKKFPDLKEHLSKRTFSCEICGNMFKRLRDLTVHIDGVHNKVAVHCPFCEKVFNCDKSKSDRLLKQHIKAVHEGKQVKK